MAFKIQLSKKAIKNLGPGEKAVAGVLEMGKYKETFDAGINYWGPEAYVKHWKEALERLVKDKNKTALITYMSDPKKSTYIFWWPMWKIRNKIYIQNQILFLKKLKRPFIEKKPFFSVGKRNTKTSTGKQISEWVVTLSEIKTFLKNFKSGKKGNQGHKRKPEKSGQWDMTH